MEQYELISKDGDKYAADVEPVSLGEGTGKIEVIRDCDYCECLYNGTEPRLFVAEIISRNLRPRLSLAKGFIFKSGDNLNHFSNVIRYNNIPACISEELWNIATQNEHKQFILKSKRCPPKSTYYQNLYSAFFDTIEKCNFQIPIINVQTQSLQKLSDKVLSVNQLLYLGYPVPRSALITGLENFVINASEILQLAPCWLPNADKLMVRPSLCGGSGINRHTSGLMSSKTVSGIEQLSAELAIYHQECVCLSQKYEPYQLSVLIQDYIPPKSNGVIFTRIPWDYSTDRFILKLSNKNGFRKYNQACYNREIQDNIEMKKVIEACFELSDFFSIPLEIEFVLSENNDIYFVQCRPAFTKYKEPVNHDRIL
jgi:hypothetical protein